MRTISVQWSARFLATDNFFLYFQQEELQLQDGQDKQNFIKTDKHTSYYLVSRHPNTTCMNNHTIKIYLFFLFHLFTTYWKIQRKKIRQNLRPNKFLKITCHKKPYPYIFVANVIMNNFTFMFFFCHSIGTWRKMSFYEGR